MSWQTDLLSFVKRLIRKFLSFNRKLFAGHHGKMVDLSAISVSKRPCARQWFGFKKKEETIRKEE